MNSIYSPLQTDTNEQIESFIQRLDTGFQNPESIEGIVNVLIPEQPHTSFSVVFNRDNLQINRNEIKPIADTTLTIPIETLVRINNEAEFLDFRDSAIIGTISIEGNMDYANHLGKACLQPSQLVRDRFIQIEELHRAKGFKNLTK